jgi:hypothetical protein
MKKHNHHGDSSDFALAGKRAELAAVRERHAKAQLILQQLQDEIAGFVLSYDRILGCRIAELERIEREILQLSGGAEGESDPEPTGGERTRESAPAGRPDDSVEKDRAARPILKSNVPNIRDVYRQVAKAVHPDLVGRGTAQFDRHELMAKANRAYAENDLRGLREILRDLTLASHPGGGDGAQPELARVIGQIARELQEFQVTNSKIEELQESYLYNFKLSVEANRAKGRDLMAELAAAADLNIATALRHLALLSGDAIPEVPKSKPAPKPKRNVYFPAEPPCGTLYLRNRDSHNYSQWKAMGHATGHLEIDIDQALRLDIKKAAGVSLAFLQDLKPDDLQSLFLYEVSDTDLDTVAHLTGLEELYLSGGRLTDDALSRLTPLTSLTQIYLYHTRISDRGLVHLQHLSGLKGLTSSGNSITGEGLASIQLAIPGIKTVSFPWKK